MEGIPKELLDEAAIALARVLSASDIRYAMCGGYLAVTLGVEDRETQVCICFSLKDPAANQEFRTSIALCKVRSKKS